MKTPAMIEGSPLMAVTTVRTVDVKRPRTSFKKIAVMIPAGTPHTIGEADLLEGADDRHGQAARSRRAQGSDTLQVLEEQVDTQQTPALLDEEHEHQDERYRQERACLWRPPPTAGGRSPRAAREAGPSTTQ